MTEQNNYGNLAGVSIVVAGHNESKNLIHSFQAIQQMDYPMEKIEVIYVDSNSTDSSLEIALSYADRCFSIDSAYPSAGEAFNVGIAAAKHDYVWISGGDIALNPAFLAKAIQRLQDDVGIVAVTGYWDEKDLRGFNTLLGYVSLEHNREEGEFFVNAPNGSVFRKSVFELLDGYDERINKGQETELGMRMKELSMKILHLNISQGLHDYDTHGIWQLSLRYFIEGKSSCRLMLLPADSSSASYFSIAKKSAFRRLFVFSTTIALLLTSMMLGCSICGILVFALFVMIALLKIIFKSLKGNKSVGYLYFRVISFVFEPVRYLGMIYVLVRVAFSTKWRGIVVCKKCGISGLDRLNACIRMLK